MGPALKPAPLSLAAGQARTPDSVLNMVSRANPRVTLRRGDVAVADQRADIIDEVTQLGTGIPAPAVNDGERGLQLRCQSTFGCGAKRRSVYAVYQVLQNGLWRKYRHGKAARRRVAINISRQVRHRGCADREYRPTSSSSCARD